MLGARLLDGGGPYGSDSLPVLLCLGPDGQIRRRPGIELSREQLPASDVWDVAGLSYTTPLRSAFDCARLMTDRIEAVMHVDLILACGFFSRDELSAYIGCHLRADRARLVAKFHQARHRGLRRDRHLDRWTLQPPPWWLDY